MARHKKIYRDEEYERDCKREKIRKAVMWTFFTLVIGGIAVMGYFQHNDTVIGIGAIVLGLLCCGYAAFVYIIRERGWKIMTMYDSPELRRSTHWFGNSPKEEEEKIFVLHFIAVVGYSILGVVLLIAGILRLFSII